MPIADARVERTAKAVVDKCKLLLASDAFAAWKGAETLRVGDLVVCNNSFLFREGRFTTKSAYYLGVRVKGEGDFELPPVVVTATGGINLQFKRFTPKELAGSEIATLEATLTQELPRLGSIVLSLVGRIADPEDAEVPILGVSGIDALRYSPGQPAPAKLSGGVISVGSLANLDVSWTAVQAAVSGAEDVKLDALGDKFEQAFRALQETAARPVDPTAISEDGPSILSEILQRMGEQALAYSAALQRYQSTPEDNEIYKELLRIAYNFADGARAFLGLMVGMCDLKPMLFWLTVFEQVELAHRFAKLPFSLVGKAKPSLERYRSVIAEARNQAFHDVFAFDHPFRVRLPGDALRSPELRLFREHAKRTDPALDFEDRRLVELLAALTRTPERAVPVGFWQGNEAVMTAVVDVVRALRQALVVVAA